MASRKSPMRIPAHGRVTLTPEPADRRTPHDLPTPKEGDTRGQMLRWTIHRIGKGSRSTPRIPPINTAPVPERVLGIMRRLAPMAAASQISEPTRSSAAAHRKSSCDAAHQIGPWGACHAQTRRHTAPLCPGRHPSTSVDGQGRRGHFRTINRKLRKQS